MKKIKIIILFILAITCQFAQSQVSDRIVDTNKRWSILSYGYRNGDPNRKFCRESSYIKFKGDSIIGSTLYKKIYKATDSLAVNWFLKGFIRKKNKKVYGRTLDNDQEYLMYDFSVEINDTISISDPFSSVYNLKMVINEIDSISLINTKKKRINLNFHDGKEIWIEGIGSMDGIVERTLNLVGGYKELLCFKENDTLQYNNPDYKQCYYSKGTLLTINPPLFQNNIEVYPNPCKNYVNLYFNPVSSRYTEATFKLYNINRQLVTEKAIDLRGPVRIDLSGFNSNAYVYAIVSGYKLLKTGKLIKQ